MQFSCSFLSFLILGKKKIAKRIAKPIEPEDMLNKENLSEICPCCGFQIVGNLYNLT